MKSGEEFRVSREDLESEQDVPATAWGETSNAVRLRFFEPQMNADERRWTQMDADGCRWMQMGIQNYRALCGLNYSLD